MFSDEAAEYRLLGAAVDSPDELLKWKESLFTGPRIQLFNAMRTAYLNYGEVSSEGVERFFGRDLPPELEMARGSKIGAVLDKLVDLGTKRQLALLSEKLAMLINQRQVSRDEINRLLTLSPIITSEDSRLSPGISEFVSDLRRKRDGKYRFVRTGLRFLDHMLGGEWPRQALTVVIGQAGSGKTALVCQSILNMARMGIPSFFASLEMKRHRLVSRFVANMSMIDGVKIKNGDLTNDEMSEADKAMAELQVLPIYIADDQRMTIDDICYQVKMHKESYGIEAFFVDYIQIINRTHLRGDDNGAEVLGDLAQRLRNVAVETDTSAIVLSQQNRAFTGLASILGSGRISHIADSVFEILVDPHSTNDDLRDCVVEFHKNRDGPVGKYQAYYKPRYLQFE